MPKDVPTPPRSPSPRKPKTERPRREGPQPKGPRREGPRPLLLHLATEGWTLASSCAASLLLKSGSPSSKPQQESPRAEGPPPERSKAESPEANPPPGNQGQEQPDPPPASLRAPEGVDPADFAEALEGEARRRYGDYLDGVARYRAHPYRRRLAEPPTVWRKGSVRLLDYGLDGQGKGPAVFVVPSLINRATILDLTGRRSLMRHLARRGLRPFLLDWGAPGEEERGFDLTDYVRKRLEPAAEAAAALTGGKLACAGYCMGGLLALALSLRRSDLIARFVGLATPWNFHADKSPQMQAMTAMGRSMADLIEVYGEMPVDMIQALFMGLDPLAVTGKFRRFAALDPRSAKAHAFVAVEDWLNDGTALAAPVARDCLLGWYAGNTPHRLEWRIAGEVVDPAKLAMPALIVVPSRDRIVPPGSARALGEAIPGAEILTVPLGHVGMIVGGTAPQEVYAPLVKWLKSNRATR